MPFKSEKQRKWMHAKEPDMAKKWEKEEKNEGNIGITTKKGKSIELTHKTSGKEIVVQNTPSILKKYAKMGYLISMPEGKERDYKAEYKKYGSSKKAKKYRAELNKYNRQKGTYGNGDKKDASHKGGKIVGFEEQSKNRGRREKSRLKKEIREAWETDIKDFGKKTKVKIKPHRGTMGAYFAKPVKPEISKLIVPFFKKKGYKLTHKSLNVKGSDIFIFKGPDGKECRISVNDDFGSGGKIVGKNLNFSLLEQKITEDYKNSEWEVYVADENRKEKVVKVAKSKRAAVILYNKLINTDKYHEVGMRVIKEGKLNESQLLKLANSVIKTKTETKGMSLTVAHHIINTYNSYKKSHPNLAKQVANLPVKKGIKFAQMIVGENKLREAIRKIIREDFAGAYPEHMRKKFDNKRRKQSEVLGYKLAGVDDIRSEIDDATVKESFEKKLKGLVKEVMYTMGAGGLQAIETGVIHLEKNSVYYLGASSSPDQIIITKVDDDWIEYVKPVYNNSKRLKIERSIGESLILDGSNTWLKMYGRFSENKKIADTLQKNLDGKKGPNNGKVKPSEYDRYVLTVKGTKGSNDVYGAAKQWGVIGHWNGKNGEEAEAELEVYKIYIPQIKKDKQFKVTKQKKGELR